jgi:cytochrome P450
VFYEALRLHANVPIQLKQATKDTVLPSGLEIKQGEFVEICAYVQGRSKAVWGEDARVFKPERFLDASGNLKQENPNKYNVFNAGKRLCLG